MSITSPVAATCFSSFKSEETAGSEFHVVLLFWSKQDIKIINANKKKEMCFIRLCFMDYKGKITRAIKHKMALNVLKSGQIVQNEFFIFRRCLSCYFFEKTREI